MKKILIALALLIALIGSASSFVVNTKSGSNCSKIKREISMCNFYAVTLSQKKICIKNAIKDIDPELLDECL
jgi:uncharacterized protein YxeA